MLSLKSKSKTLIGVGLFVLFQFLANSSNSDLRADTVKVGVLNSFTGTMAISEPAVADATLLAIRQINAEGGVLGKRIEPIIADGESSPDVFAEQAQRLITEEGVKVIFGGWTSASRKKMIPVFEKLNHLLVYPVQYEGLEQSRNIIYLGAAPNQQIIPAIKWAIDHGRTRFYLIGSDYVFPRAANEIVRDYVEYLGGKIIGESYIPLGHDVPQEVIQNIVDVIDRGNHTDMIVNTINGDTNFDLFQKLRENDVGSVDVPTMSFSLSENELRQINSRAIGWNLEGDYAAWNYFQSLSSEANNKFVKQYQDAFGSDRVTSDPIESAYSGVYLWKNAVIAAGSFEPERVLVWFGHQSFFAPQGKIYIDNVNHHTWKRARIGRINSNQQFEIVWESEFLIHPVPFPYSRSRRSWEELLKKMYVNWGSSWAFNPPALQN